MRVEVLFFIRARFHLLQMFYVWNFCMFCLICPPPLLFTMHSGERNVLCPSERGRESGERQWLVGREKRGMYNGSTCLLWDMLYRFYSWGVIRKKSATNGSWKRDPLGVNKRVIATMLLYVVVFWIFKTNTSLVKKV